MPSPSEGEGTAVRLTSLGDTAFNIEFGDTVAPGPAARVAALAQAVERARARGGLDGLIETVPTFRSLQVIYDPVRTSRDRLAPAVLALDPGDGPVTAAAAGRRWRLPVCFEGGHAPDLDEVAAALGLPPAAVTARLTAAEYRVGMLGFLPGFAYLLGLDPALHLPRRAEPRPRVPAGSLAIADGMAAIYPSDSPGGWHLLGHCPCRLFDPAADPPARLAAGDRVRLDAVPATALEAAARDVVADTLP